MIGVKVRLEGSNKLRLFLNEAKAFSGNGNLDDMMMLYISSYEKQNHSSRYSITDSKSSVPLQDQMCDIVTILLYKGMGQIMG